MTKVRSIPAVTTIFSVPAEVSHLRANQSPRNYISSAHIPGQVGERCKLDFLSRKCSTVDLHHLDHRPHIKLKKDYTPGLGDSADLVIIGGRRDAQQAHALGMEDLLWTTFYLACPFNKITTQITNDKVTFRIVGFVERPCIPIRDIRYLNNHGKLYQVPFKKCTRNMEIDIDQLQVAQPTELFTRRSLLRS
jgi:hypothetical protein